MDTKIGDIEAKIDHKLDTKIAFAYAFGVRGKGWPASGETLATRHFRSFALCISFCNAQYNKDRSCNGCGWNPNEKLCKLFKNDQGHVAKNTQWYHFHAPCSLGRIECTFGLRFG